jgi:hypothetical protein
LIRKFQHRALLFNPATMEVGAVRKAYESKCVTMYEVAVSKDGEPGRHFIFPIGQIRVCSSPPICAAILHLGNVRCQFADEIACPS